MLRKVKVWSVDVNQAIESNPNYGKGYGPINHLHSIIINKKFR